MLCLLRRCYYPAHVSELHVFHERPPSEYKMLTLYYTLTNSLQVQRRPYPLLVGADLGGVVGGVVVAVFEAR
jgi:hypothetical protein